MTPRRSVVLLLHGLAGSPRWWDRNADALGREHPVYRLDLLSLVRPFVLASAADRVAEWMGRERIDQASLIGHSMGGAIALDLAARYPGCVDRLVLVDAAVRPIPLGRRVRGVLVAGWRAPFSIAPLVARDALRAGPVGLVRATRDVLALDLRVPAAAVRAPTLLVWGERDTIVPPEIGRELAATLPGSRLEVIPDAAHNPMWEQPAAFNRVVLDFLR